MESLFYVYFRKWCSGASQIAFHDCRKSLQNHVFQELFIWPAPAQTPEIVTLRVKYLHSGLWPACWLLANTLAINIYISYKI